MFLPAGMKHATLLIPRQRSQSLIISLHEKGICQIKECNEKGLEGLESSLSEETNEASQRLSKLMNDLQEFKPVPQPENMVKALFFPTAPIKIKADLLSNKQVLEEVNMHLGIIEPKANKLLLELEGTGQRLEEIELALSELLTLPNIDISIFRETENLAIISGFASTKDLPELEKSLGNAVFFSQQRDENTSLLIIASRQVEKALVEKELHSIGFEPLTIEFSKGTPGEIAREKRKEKIGLLKRNQEIKLFLRNMAKQYWARLEILTEELSFCTERALALEGMKAGKSFAVLEAWVPEKNFDSFKQLVKEHAGDFYMQASEKEDAPTLLNNPPMLKPFEMITNLYSLPKAKALDPTPVIAITFALFFGYMLTDFVYGVAMALIAFGIFRGIGKYNQGLRDFSAVLIALGIATALLGAAFTSYFGDFFPRIGIQMPGLLDPLKEVITIIGIAIIIGVLHISLGLLMGFADNLRLGKKREAFSSQGVWLLFLIGAGLAVFGLMDAGLALIILSVILHVVFSVMEGGPVIGILSIFDFSGFVGDIFSYARLAALAIGTAGIALAVNFMALMVYDMVPVVGFLLAIVVFLVGHSFNMIMNGLGAFIHSLRLHFLEFFQKFYEGGGTAYRPFHAKRQKTGGI